eukprot:14866448-Ditylum_brightwellii.AAC.1
MPGITIKEVSRCLEYLLLATTLTEEQCTSIEAPALKVALQGSGLASNFPWLVLFRSSRYMGMDGKRLYVTQGIKYSRALMDHRKVNLITGKQICACIEQHKMEIGTGWPLVDNDYNKLKFCTTSTWIAHTWEFMHKNSLHIEEETPNLHKVWDNDQYIRDAFLKAGYHSQELATLNRCRLWLKVANCSDLAMGDGKKMHQSTLDGILIPYCNDLHCCVLAPLLSPPYISAPHTDIHIV